MMTHLSATFVTALADRRALPLWLAAVACFVLAGAAHAQTLPYESRMRGRVGTGLGQDPMATGLTLRPRIETGVLYADNINLVENPKDQVNTAGLELTPGIYASYLSSNFTGIVDYSLIGRVWDESDYNGISQRGDANGRWTVVQDLFHVDGQASVSEEVISPQDGLNYGKLGAFGYNNLTQVASAALSPTFRKRFSEFGLLARYTYGRTWYFDQGSDADQAGFNGQEDSRDQHARVAFGNQESERKLTGRVFYDWDRSDYDNALPYNYERLGADLGWQVAASISIVGQFGIESDLEESTTEGGLDSNFWSAGLRWQPDSRTHAEARYGERFFGHSYFFSAKRTTRMFEFEASYSESPDVQTRVLSLGSFTPGELPPSVGPGLNFGALNSEPYVGKNARVGVAAIGSLTELRLVGYQNERDYINLAQEDDNYTGVTFVATRQLASNLSVDFSANYLNTEQSQPDDSTGTETTDNYDDTQFIARLVRESSGGRLTTSFETGYFNRSGTEQYNGWWCALRARWLP